MQVYQGYTAVQTGNFVEVENNSPNVAVVWIGTSAELASWDVTNDRDPNGLYITTDGGGTAIESGEVTLTEIASSKINLNGIPKLHWVKYGGAIHYYTDINLEIVDDGSNTPATISFSGLPFPALGIGGTGFGGQVLSVPPLTTDERIYFSTHGFGYNADTFKISFGLKAGAAIDTAILFHRVTGTYFT